MTFEEAEHILEHYTVGLKDYNTIDKRKADLIAAIDVALLALQEHTNKHKLDSDNYAKYSANLDLPC